MPSKLKKAIGAVKDQTSIGLAKVANGAAAGGSALEVAILKATTHDELPIDDRLVSEILGLISSNEAYAAACAASIGKRIGRTRNWIVALKSLIVVLRIFQDGDPYFPLEVLHAMKRGAKILNLSSFRDDSNSSPWDYTAFVRTFALYLDERLDCFLTGKLQRRYTNRHQTETTSRLESRTGRKNYEPAVRDMKPMMLLDKITYWQRLLDRAIATRPTGAAKSNKLVKTSLYAVVQESFDLYKDISDGLALLLDSFFHMQYQSCVQAFQACVRASKQFEELNGFYDFCKSNGVGRTSEYPSVQKISEELLETLQEFLKDQSSFPANGRSPSTSPSPNLLLPPPSSKDSMALSSHERGESFDMSDRYSDFGSYCSTSLDDLISMAESGASPPMSCYSEPYGKQDNVGNNFDTVSTKSLPSNPSASNLTLELVLFEDVNADSKGVPEDQENSIPPKNVEKNDPREAMILGDDRSRNAGEIPEEPSKEDQRDSGNWLLVLEESATKVPVQVHNDDPTAIISNGFESPTTDALLDPTAVIQSTPKQYNPFLEEPADPFAVSPTFQATMTELQTLEAAPAAAFHVEPTFRVKNPADFEASSMPTFQATATETETGTSPMAFSYRCEPPPTSMSFGFEEKFSVNGCLDQKTLLQEQQLWLQNQNKIMAKHLN